MEKSGYRVNEVEKTLPRGKVDKIYFVVCSKIQNNYANIYIGYYK